MDPYHGLINDALALIGIDGPGWLTDPNLALYSVALVDVWKGVGLATLIYIAGIVADPAASTSRPPGSTAPAPGRCSGTSSCRWPARPPSTVIILSLIGGLRSFDLIWAMTRGGPGLHLRRHRLGDLQAVPGRLLRPVDRRQRDPLPRGDADRAPAVRCLNRRRSTL